MPASPHLPLQKLGAGIALSLTMAICLAGCRKAQPAVDETPAVAVTAVHPHIGPITAHITGDALLAPSAQAAIQSKVTAPIKKFYVQRGARVKAGQLLATLEDRDLAAAAMDNRGAYAAAQGTFALATRQQLPQEATQARLDLEQATATLHLNESIVKARAQLFAEGATPGRDLDTAKAALLQAQAAYQVAKQRLDAITSVGGKAALESAQGQLTSARGKYLGAEALLAYTQIRTPIAGVVSDRPLFAGETAIAGTPVVTVMDTSTLLAKLHLAQAQARQLVVGTHATLTIDGIDHPFDANVSFVSPVVDTGSTTVEVWVSLKNPNSQLTVGGAAHATIDGRTTQTAVLVPSTSIQRSSESGESIAMVLGADGIVHKRAVTEGAQADGMTQILEGLTPADLVVTEGSYGLEDGAKVRLEDAPAKPAAGEKE